MRVRPAGDNVFRKSRTHVQPSARSAGGSRGLDVGQGRPRGQQPSPARRPPAPTLRGGRNEHRNPGGGPEPAQRGCSPAKRGCPAHPCPCQTPTPSLGQPLRKQAWAPASVLSPGNGHERAHTSKIILKHLDCAKRRQHTDGRRGPSPRGGTDALSSAPTGWKSRFPQDGAGGGGVAGRPRTRGSAQLGPRRRLSVPRACPEHQPSACCTGTRGVSPESGESSRWGH